IRDNQDDNPEVDQDCHRKDGRLDGQIEVGGKLHLDAFTYLDALAARGRLNEHDDLVQQQSQERCNHENGQGSPPEMRWKTRQTENLLARKYLHGITVSASYEQASSLRLNMAARNERLDEPHLQRCGPPPN